LDTHLKTDGSWNGKRVILFTEYRATLGWMEQILSSHGYGGDRLMILHGSIDPGDRERIKAAFQAHPDVSSVRILLATDAASEGIDLQNHCNYMIHIEIPWNPNVMEQRNGRIDRHGQKEKTVHIWHPVGKGFALESADKEIPVGKIEGDHEYLMRAVLKINTIREDLGSVGPVIARQIEEAMLGRRTGLDTTVVEAKAASVRRFVAAERKLQERITRLHEKLMEAKIDFHLSPERISMAVRVGLELAEKPPLKPVSLPQAPKGTVFEVPLLPGSWGRATVGLEHPHTGQRRPVTFDHEVAKGRDDVVLMHLNHRLVQMCLRLLREELWKLDDVKKLHRISVRSVPDGKLSNPAMVVFSRLVVTSGDHRRLHEEITLAGGELKEDDFVRITQVGKLESLVESGVSVEPDPGTFKTFSERFQRNEEAIKVTVEARSKDRLKSLESIFERRKTGDIEDMNEILAELEKNIQSELLNQQKPEQLTLWQDDERDQLRRDIEALKFRLARIPEEKKAEAALIEKRYVGLTNHTFPVAIVLIAPQSFLNKT